MKILYSLQVVFVVAWITPLLENSKKKKKFTCKKKMKCELYKYNYSNSIHR